MKKNCNFKKDRSSLIEVAILGVSGKMGRCLLRKALEDPEIRVIGGCNSQKDPRLGQDLGLFVSGNSLGIFIEKKEQLLSRASIAIDFSSLSVLEETLEMASHYQCPLAIGVTGQEIHHHTAMQEASRKIPLLYAPNFSLGIASMERVLKDISSSLGEACMIDIVESHHVNKRDIPSGTALLLARACGRELAERDSPRKENEIAIHSLRRGEVVGEHVAIITCHGEKIEISHTAFSRDIFALGALKAIKILIDQFPGFYTLQKILFPGHHKGDE